jgi:UDP-N-acetylmuramyl pentapeptide synthase
MLFFSFVIFIDEFELYKNVYHSVNDIYAMSTALCELKKQKNKNAFILILNSHEAKLKNVLDCLQIDLKNIDRDCFLIINEEQTFV